ncbi:MAG: thioredoxin family protein [Prosthecobacter sp.]|jgi:thiol:disulfide interchange protein|nr:thioredoxin family protein [Prosthecobacter sp.]
MRCFSLALSLLFAGALPSSAQIDLAVPAAKSAPVSIRIVSEVKAAAPGQVFRVAVRVDHAEHWHTYGKTLSPGIIGKPTKLRWTLPEGWTVEELPWPPTHEVESTDGKKSEGYDGVVYLPAQIKPSGKPGDQAELSVILDALACDPKNCRPVKPDAKLTVALAASAEVDPEVAEIFAAKTSAPSAGQAMKKAPAGTASRSFVANLLLAFIGGLILNIMPCVFPVLGIKVLSVVQQAGGEKKHVLLHGLTYTAGILVCFWLLGSLVVAFGKAWGFQLQSPGFVFALCSFFLIFSLSMAGVFEIGASAVGVGQDLQAREGLGGSFFSGLLAVVVATPCSAPFLGTALGYAVTLPALQALMMFSMIGLGLASPFLVMAVFPVLVSALPRPGAWMESFKQGLSFLLFGTVGFLLWVLTGMVQGQPLLFAILGLVLMAMGCWIYGRWCLPHKALRTRRTALLLALACIAGGLWAGWPVREEKWPEWSPEKVAELRAAGVPVYIDFTAQWCVTCQVNKRVYKDAALKQLITDKKVVLLKADWTNDDPRITQALSDLGKAAVPVNVLYLPGKEEPVVLPELLTVENVTAALNQIPGP